MQSDTCRPGLAPLGLDEADHVARRALGLEVVVDGGVEGHHAHVVGQGPALVGVAGAQDELVLTGLEAPRRRRRRRRRCACQSPARTAAMTRWVSGPRRGPRAGGHEGEDLLGHVAHLVGEHDLFDVHLVLDELDEGPQPLGIARWRR